jgi:hypothetical protein
MHLTNANIRCSSFYVAETQSQCPRCRRSVRVLALGLPPGHETLADDEWHGVDANAFIFHLVALPETVSRLLFERSPAFHWTGADDPAEASLANHCPYCARVFNDDELHCEPGGFMPDSIAEAHAISLTKVDQAFSAFAAGYALEPEFFASMCIR